LKHKDEVFCVNYATRQFHWKETLVVIGGTGAFKSASGKLTLAGTGDALAASADGLRDFGGVTMKNHGTIVLNTN
jgi:hypothetical protein